MIEVYFNDTLLDLPDDETVALTKWVNDIGELSLRKADFTREFRVKRTRDMESLFENAGIIASQTTIPYQDNSALLLYDGLEQIRNGKLALIRSDDDYYYINLYSGAKNIFDNIAEITLNDLDLSDLEHDWTFQNAAHSVENDLDYQYLLFDPSDDGGLISDTPTSPPGFIFYTEQARPFVKLKRIWDQIWTDQGITCTSDIDSNTLFLKMFQSISTTDATNASIFTLLTTHIGVEQTLSGRTKLIFTEALYDPKGVMIDSIYYAKYTGTYYFKIPYALLLTLDVDVDINSVQTAVDNLTSDIFGYYFSLTLTANDAVAFYVTKTSGLIDKYTPALNVYNIDPSSIGYGSSIEVQRYLEPMKQSDFVKAVCNFFGLIPSYNSLENTLHFWSLNNILQNRIIAKDWSQYLSVDDSELVYSIDKYQQKNWLKWKESDDVIDGSGDYYLICNNKSLEKEQDLIELPISFSDEVTHQSNTMCRIAWYKSIEGSAEYNEETKIDPRWLTSEAVSLDVAYQHDLFQEVVDSSNAKQAKSATLSFGANIGNFAAVQSMITSPKVINVKMNIPSKEIQNLDHSIPVFLEQFSEYFYVNKVGNWQDGYLCDVELIRI